MAKGEDITTHFKVDISEFKKGITEANQTIKESNSVFNKSTAGLEDWGKSADGLRAKITQMTTSLQAQNQKLEAYQNQLRTAQQYEQKAATNVTELRQALERAKTEYGENSTEVKQLEKQLSAAEKTYTSMKSQVSTLTVTLNNQEATVQKTSRELEGYKTALTSIESPSKKLNSTITEQRTELDKLKDKYKDLALAQGRDSDEAKELATQINRLSTELRENQTRLNGAEEAANELDNALDRVDPQGASQGFTVLKGALSNLVADGIRKAIEGIKELAKSAIDYESSFTNVKKTVDGTDEEIAKLDKDIRAMAKTMPQSASDIAEVASAAGQLGIKTGDISKFTKTMIMLGDSTNLSSEEAASALAKFANVTKMSADDYDKLGSVIVALGNNFATTESDIVNMGTRLASAGSQVGLSQAEIMSMAAALSSVGLEAESGGTAFSKLMINMQVATETGGEQLTNFARISGMTTKEFKKAFEEDATKAIAAFLTGLNDTDKNGKSAIATLDEMGIRETRLRDTILRAANASDVFSDAVKTGNTAWEENSALANEANQRYETTASKIQIMKNNFIDLGLSLFDKVQPAVQKTLEGLTALANNESKIKALTTAAKALMGAFVLSKITSMTSAFTAQRIAITASTAATTLFANTTRTAAVGTNALTVATNLFTVATNALKVAWATNPIGLIATVAAVAVTGIYALTKAIKENKASTDENVIATDKLISKQKELTTTINENKTARTDSIEAAKQEGATAAILAEKIATLSEMENKSSAQKATLKALVTDLNNLMPELNLKYDEEKDKLNMSTEALKQNITAQQELLKAKAAQEGLAAIAADMAKLEMQQGDLIKQNTINQLDYNKAKENLGVFEQEHGTNRARMNLEEVQQYKELLKAVDEKRAAYEKSEVAVTKNQTALNKLNSEYEKTTKYAESMFSQAEIEQKLAALTDLAKAGGVDIPKALIEGINSGKYAIPESIEGLQALIKFDEALNSAKLAGVDIPTSISQGVVNGKVSVDEAIKQVNDIVKFNNAIEESNKAGNQIPKSISDGILNGKLSVDEATKQMNNWIKFQTALSETDKAGAEIPKKLKEGILNGTVSVTDAIDQVNKKIGVETLKLPSVVRKNGLESGLAYLDGLSKGVNDNQKQSSVFRTTKQIGDDMKAKLNNSLEVHSPSKATEQAGLYFLDGIINGVKSGNKQNSIFSAISNLGSRMLAKMRAALEEHSPSKATNQMGQFLLDGLGLGIKEKEDTVLNQISKFGKNVIGNLTDELSENVEVQDMINNIKTSISKARSSISSMSVPNLSTTNGATGNAATTKNIVNNYNQVINAPQQPSRAELYRQTKNLLELAKGGA